MAIRMSIVFVLGLMLVHAPLSGALAQRLRERPPVVTQPPIVTQPPLQPQFNNPGPQIYPTNPPMLQLSPMDGIKPSPSLIR